MTETIQLEEAIQIHDAPKLLIEWPSPWEEFVTSIRPALSRSTGRLAGEAPVGLRPYRGMIATWLIEAFLLFVIIVLPMKIAQLRPYVAPQLSGHDVIYYSGDELPRTEDLGGSQAGTSGRAGGREAHHRTQTIKIARGHSLVPKVVDAPNLKLPASRESVANLLVVKPNPGPPPLEGVRSARAVLTLPASLVAPAPTLSRDYARGTPSLGSVIPPAPSVSRDQAPATPALDPSVIAPAPNVSRDKARSAPALSASVISPAPAAVSREISRSPVQMTDANVVPPPVSAPERETVRNPKLTLPATSVIAPPPSTDAASDLHRLASGSVQDPSKSVVPPPPTPAGSPSLMSSLIGKIFGTTDVVPPPPTVNTGTTSGNPRGSQGGSGTSLNPAVVPPPPAVGGSAAAGGRAAAGGSSPGSASVIQPPPSVSGSGTGTGSGTPGGPGGTLLSNNVVPPPPSLGGGSGEFGSGLGSKGTGRGGALDTGSAVAPPNSGGSGGSSGVVVSDQPGSKVGIPAGGTGSLAMSPGGGDKPGLGGAGGGDSGIGHGTGTGSGLSGEGSGAGKTGTGPGSDPNAHGGISPTAGPGGAGNGTSGVPAVPGVSVQGGSSSIVTLPSFGSDGGSGPPTVPGRSSVKEHQGPDVAIVATSRSGGAFNFYGRLPGDMTVYVPTSLGWVPMQVADPTSASHTHAGNLVGPDALRVDLPAGLPRSRLVVQGTLNASGNLKNLRVLEAGPADMTAKVMTALLSWKFRPAMRGTQPIEVTVILGFGIDTNDHF